MKTSIIRQRVADFLKGYAPFDTLSSEDLLALAGSGKVKFHESEEYLFRQGETHGQILWIIQQGRVDLVEESATGERLCDVLGEGDLAGLDRFAGVGLSLSSARTATDVVLYGVSSELFETFVTKYPAVRRFLEARFSISGKVGFGRASWLDAEAPPLEFLRARKVSIGPDAVNFDARASIAQSRNGVVALVDAKGHPNGTITGENALFRPCPTTAAYPLSTRSIVREMLQTGGDHIAVTVDGTADSPLEAIITSSELAMFCGYNPVLLIQNIRNVGSAAEVAPLLGLAGKLVQAAMAQPQDVGDCCRIGTEVVAALAETCIRLAADDLLAAGMELPKSPYCWVLFGASSRGDLLTPELPIIASVYRECSSTAEDSLYFAALAGETASRFHALGLSGPGLDWPDGARPSMPLSEWRRLYSETIRNPTGHDLYARRTFFDMRVLSGDAAILEELEDHIIEELRHPETAIPLLANDTLRHQPPLTFFQGLVLDMDGGQYESFDIHETVIAPLSNGARVFAIAKRHLSSASTLARLELAAADFPDGAEIIHQAMDAFRIGLYYQALANGSRINPGMLGKFDQRLLKTAFTSVQRFLEFTLTTFVPSI